MSEYEEQYEQINEEEEDGNTTTVQFIAVSADEHERMIREGELPATIQVDPGKKLVFVKDVSLARVYHITHPGHSGGPPYSKKYYLLSIYFERTRRAEHSCMDYSFGFVGNIKTRGLCSWEGDPKFQF